MSGLGIAMAGAALAFVCGWCSGYLTAVAVRLWRRRRRAIGRLPSWRGGR